MKDKKCFSINICAQGQVYVTEINVLCFKPCFYGFVFEMAIVDAFNETQTDS